MKYNLYTQKTFKIPKSLNLKELLSKYPPSFKKGKFKEQSALAVIDTVIRKHHNCEQAVKFNCSIIYSKSIQKKVYNYSDYIRWFESVGVIKLVSNYSSGFRAKGYRLCEPYLSANIVHTQITDKLHIKRLKAIAKNDIRDEYFISHSHLFKGYSENLTIDGEALLAFAIQHNMNVSKADLIVESILNQEYRFKVDNFGGRFYNSISYMNKCYRKFLSFNGNSLASIDIKCSQPYLLNLVLNKNSEHSTPLPPPFLICSEKLQEINSTEIDKWLRITADGSIYEEIGKYMVEEIGKDFIFKFKIYSLKLKKRVTFAQEFPLVNYSNSKAQLRDISKKILLIYLFGNKSELDLFIYFQTNFPKIHNYLKELKTCADEKLLPRTMQKIEATLILDIITAEFSNENPDAVVFTIHDSIATQIQFIQVLEKKAKEVFSRYIQTPPQFHLEYWCEDNLDLEKLAA